MAKTRLTQEDIIERYKKLNITLHGTYKGSSIKLNVECNVCGHKWQSRPDHAGTGVGCPACANARKGATQRKTYEQFISELPNNIECISTEYKNAHTDMFFRCKTCKHEWITTPSSLKGCIKCGFKNSAKLRSLPEDSYLENLPSNIELLEYGGSRHVHSLHKCLDCGHTWSTCPGNIIAGTGCPRCAKKGISKPEIEVQDYVSSLVPNVLRNKRFNINNTTRELDIYISDLNLGIEYCGMYWHSETKLGRKYHLEKLNLFNSIGIRVVQIFEYEWLQKPEIVRSRIACLLGKSTVIYARECSIVELDAGTSRDFDEENHIQGHAPASIRYGLVYYGELVASMTFCKARFSDAEWELLRYSSLLDINVIGGASKLFKHFIRQNNPNVIVSYSDRRWNTGKVYEVLGFKLSHYSEPNYWYFKGKDVFSRVKFQKHKLQALLESFDPNKTEYENMLDNKYDRIFDCGNSVYFWHK